MLSPDPARIAVKKDPWLSPYAEKLRQRHEKAQALEKRLTPEGGRLCDFASGHEYFGLHFRDNEWVFREWAPNASAIRLIGDMTDWRELPGFALERVGEDGVWEARLPSDKMAHGDHYRLRVHWPGGEGDRIPAYARRVLQDPETLLFTASVWQPETPYPWNNPSFTAPDDPPMIYEAHIGMAQEREGVGTYREFTENVLPRVQRAGYNALQVMALAEHPYYASFGYQVSSFFAASSRFGTPDDLKALIDAAHERGISVFMDVIHSHGVANEVEGLSRFDGTLYQYFHDLPRGLHPAWDSRLFDYGKVQVLHFLLSNCRFWLDEYKVDGFRFDGVTSMLYLHHGMEKAFTGYDGYFGDDVDEDALAYLTLANRVVHQVRPDAVTIAEDVSGMPLLAAPFEEAGAGFDFRFAMGTPDYWIRLVKDTPDEAWQMGKLWYELTNRRPEERTIGYAESHDQALVGDQTLAFRLMGERMYDHMRVGDPDIRVERGMALIKLIRLLTLATAGGGYLNFMGNEFGHPEWIDFPRLGNGWSYRYARRQWRLADDPDLRYHRLAAFDRAMLRLARRYGLLECPHLQLLAEHNDDKILAFERGGLLFAFCFHPSRSRVDYPIHVPGKTYRLVFDTDAEKFDGYARISPDQTFNALGDGRSGEVGRAIRLYLPARTAMVLEKTEE